MVDDSAGSCKTLHGDRIASTSGSLRWTIGLTEQVTRLNRRMDFQRTSCKELILMMIRSCWTLTLAALTATTCVMTDGAFAQIPGRPGQSPPGQITADQITQVRTIVDRDSIGPGETFHVLAIFDIQQPWHIYWKNPGEAGALAPSVDLTVPEGFTVGEIRWPRPKLINSPAGEMFCYEDQAALFVPVTAPESLSDGEVRIESTVRFAVCDARRCLFGRDSGRVTIRTTSAARNGEADDAHPTVANNRHRTLIERHVKRLPHVITPDHETSAISFNGETLTITGPAHGNERLTFFPLDSQGVTYDQPTITLEDDRFTVTVNLTVQRHNFIGGPPKVGGLVALGRRPDDPAYEGAIQLD
jgi:DsbC/DsbD-like thiol-disulfide interchange protein